MNSRKAVSVVIPAFMHITLTYNGISIVCFKIKAPFIETIMVIMNAIIAIMNAKMTIMNTMIAIMISLFQILKSL